MDIEGERDWAWSVSCLLIWQILFLLSCQNAALVFFPKGLKLHGRLKDIFLNAVGLFGGKKKQLKADFIVARLPTRQLASFLLVWPMLANFKKKIL